MSDNDYERALDAAKRELDELTASQQVTEKRITTLKQLIANLMTLRDQDVPPDFIGRGLTEACRNILWNSPVGASPTEVRSALLASGFNIEKYSNMLASIHSVLKRFVESGQAETVERDGKTVYKMRVPPPPSEAPSPPDLRMPLVRAVLRSKH